ncbi:hypothetical protein MBM_05267 [Drepanopeziza brunnea f. sp. 'multigermtubi' MB_m1]|uniref:Uncharacterized protein n=1 Tax=Marssonina brunnea f. sp. multigermtubi (strain MB_m1) TaxID=1072389 RepID=K1X813_MARBU|nr:uncharacterized protein MBM_05267 [Drepanopeziza brunnea f. sp. 'multigermtubi' MB_m1]EKD16798.1 hypothetical protein MBM_05267 [Drepanopeziza brunnea f. sp. 'multigermtubi' MB_m1]
MLTTVKALRCIKCINNKITSKFNKDYYNYDTSVIRYLRCAKGSYSNCTVAFAAINTAFDNFLALNAAFLKGVASSPSGLASRNGSFKTTNRDPMTRSASSISPFPLAPAALVAPVAFAAPVAPVAPAAPVAPVALIIVALFALVIAPAAFAAAPVVAMTLAERRAKIKRLLKALIDLLL